MKAIQCVLLLLLLLLLVAVVVVVKRTCIMCCRNIISNVKIWRIIKKNPTLFDCTYFVFLSMNQKTNARITLHVSMHNYVYLSVRKHDLRL